MNSQNLYKELQTIVEGARTTTDDGKVWMEVYLENSGFKGKPGFPQALAKLEREGKYKAIDHTFFGAVLVGETIEDDFTIEFEESNEDWLANDLALIQKANKQTKLMKMGR